MVLGLMVELKQGDIFGGYSSRDGTEFECEFGIATRKRMLIMNMYCIW